MAIPGGIKEDIGKIKPLSQTAMRLMNIVSDPEHTMDQVAAVVESDPVLTGNVLRVVNSAAFGLSARISAVSRAVSFTGDNLVVGLALHLCAGGVFNHPLEGYESERGALWRHCLYTAIASREVARLSGGRADPEVAYTAGILHDIGKAVLSGSLNGRTREVLAMTDSQDAHDFRTGEMSLLGTDHCEVGASIGVHWSLPEPLNQVIRFHHEPEKTPEENRHLAYAVHLGDFIAMMEGAATGADSMIYTLDEKYKEYVSISSGELERIIYEAGQEYNQTVESMFGEEEG